ncbi:MAG TPA: hypothetical protein VJ850_11020 [Candidatus Limnocylindrales bacterium]|nr:hypothetical protein [Candidatus Limnocylindrales bacterium]
MCDVKVNRRYGAFVFALACGLAVGACAQGNASPSISTAPGAIVSELDGAFLVIDAPTAPIRAGEPPSFIAELRNERATDVQYSNGGCAFADLEMMIPAPWQPTGRAWDGTAAWFKDYLLHHAYGPGGVAASSPVTSTLLSTPCVESSGILRPGQTLKADFTRAIGNFVTTYSFAPTMPFSMTVNLDPQKPLPPPPTGNGIPGHFFQEYRQVSASGTITIAGKHTAVLSAGQAIDALLEDGRTTEWLEEQDLPTCQTANLFIDNDTAPEGNATAAPLVLEAVWFIELFCETDTERHFVAARVDAATGEIRRFEACDKGCE